MIVKAKTYRILVKEHNKATKEITITTDRDIEWTMDQYSRNRHIEKWEILEVVNTVHNLLLG